MNEHLMAIDARGNTAPHEQMNFARDRAAEVDENGNPLTRAEYLTQVRERTGLQIGKMATATGYSRPHLSAVEGGTLGVTDNLIKSYEDSLRQRFGPDTPLPKLPVSEALQSGFEQLRQEIQKQYSENAQLLGYESMIEDLETEGRLEEAGGLQMEAASVRTIIDIRTCFDIASRELSFKELSSAKDYTQGMTQAHLGLTLGQPSSHTRSSDSYKRLELDVLGYIALVGNLDKAGDRGAVDTLRKKIVGMELSKSIINMLGQYPDMSLDAVADAREFVTKISKFKFDSLRKEKERHREV